MEGHGDAVVLMDHSRQKPWKDIEFGQFQVVFVLCKGQHVKGFNLPPLGCSFSKKLLRNIKHEYLHLF